MGWAPKKVAANETEAANTHDQWSRDSEKETEADSRFKSGYAKQAVKKAKEVGIERANAMAWTRLDKELTEKLTDWRHKEATWVDTHRDDIDKAKAYAEFREQSQAAQLQSKLDKKADKAPRVELATAKREAAARKRLKKDGGQFAPLADEEVNASINNDYTPASVDSSAPKPESSETVEEDLEEGEVHDYSDAVDDNDDVEMGAPPPLIDEATGQTDTDMVGN